jgi:CRP-like cAMP-binding protein
VQTLRQPASLPLDDGSIWPAGLLSLASSRSVCVAQGEVFVREGETAPSWHFLRAGAVSVSCTSHSGRLCILAILGRGDLLTPTWQHHGDRSSVGPQAQALVESTLLLVPSSDIEHLLQEDGEVALWICCRLQRQAERCQGALARVIGLRVRHRVLETLLDLARRHGRPAGSGTRISIPLSQETLGSMVGATRESVNRAMRSLEVEGAVRRRGDSYIVLTGSKGQGAGERSR